MIRRLLAWLGIARDGFILTPDTWQGHTVWHWRCLECSSGSGVAPSYEVALNAARTHQRTQHGEVSA